MNVLVFLATSCKLPKKTPALPLSLLLASKCPRRVIAQVAVNNRTSPVFQNLLFLYFYRKLHLSFDDRIWLVNHPFKFKSIIIAKLCVFDLPCVKTAIGAFISFLRPSKASGCKYRIFTWSWWSKILSLILTAARETRLPGLWIFQSWKLLEPIKPKTSCSGITTTNTGRRARIQFRSIP